MLINQLRTVMDREKSAIEAYQEMLKKEEDGSEKLADTMQEAFDKLKKQERVSHPPHYTWLKKKCGIEVIDITRHMDFDLGCAIKYILRAGHKSEEGMTNKEKTIEDLKKAVWYINDKIKTLESC